MSSDPPLNCLILEISQIAWTLEMGLVPPFYILSIQHLITYRQSLLVYLSLTRKLI